MSGSGGFYKYRCKYFLTHDCPNWVFVNYAPCADCCAAGRDADDLSDDGPSNGFYHSHHHHYAAVPEFEIGVPIFQDGILRYTLAGVTSSLEPGSDFASWTTHRPPMAAALSSSYPPQQRQQGQDLHHPHPGQYPQQSFFNANQQPNVHLQQQHQQQQTLQYHQQPPPPQELFKLQGSSPGRQAAQIKMQLPPHASSKVFPVATAAGGVGEMMPAGSQGLLLY